MSLCRTVVSEVITGYLPNLILLLFLKSVPPIMEFLSSFQGYISHSDIEKSACNKVLWFTIWNIFFATLFSGSVLSQVDLFLEPKNIPTKLAVAVPAQVIIFLCINVTCESYVITTINFSAGIVFHRICCDIRMDKHFLGALSCNSIVLQSAKETIYWYRWWTWSSSY